MVRQITREELKAKLDRGDDFRLIMVMERWHYKAQHIPGSILMEPNKKGMELLSAEEEIVCYCSHSACSTSRRAANLLEKAGFTNVWHYDGGLDDWRSAGYPLEGTAVQ